MPPEHERLSIRIPHDVYERVRAETPSFTTETARIQFLIQFYLDYTQHGQTPVPPSECSAATDESENNDTATEYLSPKTQQ